MSALIQMINTILLVLVIYAIYVIAFKFPRRLRSMEEKIEEMKKLLLDINSK